MKHHPEKCQQDQQDDENAAVEPAGEELELDLGDKELDFDEAFLLESLRVRPLKPLPEDPEADPLPAEAVTVYINEVAAASYMRGREGKVPGPAPQAPAA